MDGLRTAIVVIFFGICASALAQTPGLGETRPVTPAPEDKKMPAPDAQKRETDAERAVSRCNELSGTLREDCLRESRATPGEAAAGATRRPEPPTAPPPQNPL